MIDQHTIALVTGADRGLGAMFVEMLIARGARKVYAATRKPVDATARNDSRIVPITLDVTKPQDVQRAAEVAGDVTLLINNAGVNTQTGPLDAAQPEHARAEMEVNYFGTIAMANAFAPRLIAARGAMVNVLSVLARATLPAMTTLCASKAAGLRLTEGLDAELAPQGVRVYAVMPGAIDTDMSRDYPGDKLTTREVVDATLDAIGGAAREIYIGAMAERISATLSSDRAALHAQLLGAAQAQPH
ncbi:SDR family NAD(P)-dependent oxidoreductase [Burkholderia multivorans]|uniref:SDR family NAD(P)-dependent oxidoreductase n=1 Tax=Burkholderia multivorans TaxID=87883 RepID=UPI001C27DD0F|nr:SDR family NAD(P)-dependent oxidoreductase [Burkholderia multivorans]MBU9597993.1 SDR family NAD(P)-dependent oxidoreductase [Burkholderia multivorans]